MSSPPVPAGPESSPSTSQPMSPEPSTIAGTPAGQPPVATSPDSSAFLIHTTTLVLLSVGVALVF